MLPRTYYSEQDVRKRQIDTLKIFNDHVVEVTENSEYRVEFGANGKNMSLTVILSPDFPNDKPSIYVNPPIPHHWLAENSNQVVGAPGLMNYTQHSDLGRVVQAIIREFQRSMPKFCNNDDNQKLDASPPSHNSRQSLMFPELNEWSINELQEALDNTDLQDKILESNPQLVELEHETEDLMTSIEGIAQDNIGKQQIVENLKTEVVDRISTIVQMKMNFEEMHQKYQKMAEIYNPNRISEFLKQAAVKADEESEHIAEQFLLGNMPVETFILEFAEKRALGQARRAKQERLADQLKKLEKANITF